MVKKIIILLAFIIAVAAILFFFGRGRKKNSQVIDLQEFSNENIESDESPIPEKSSEEAGETTEEAGTPERVKNDAPSVEKEDKIASESFLKKNEESENNKEKKKDGISIVDKPLPAGFRKSSGRAIDTIVIHSSYNALGGDPYSAERVMQEYIQYGVSAHYLIDRKGTIYRMVKDQDIAYHAGVSRMPDGRINVNEFSLGIEIITTKEERPTDEEYQALNALIADLTKKYSIRYIVGHQHIAPDRKDDPWNFDWTKITRDTL